MTVDPQSGQVHLGRVVVAHDCGLIVNPDGLTNQIEGNVIQSASRTLLERVTFDDAKVTSVDWRSYPILRFADIPTVDVVLINHPEQPAWGAGECATLTTGPAIANAIFWATGARVRDIPLTADRVLSAQGYRTRPTASLRPPVPKAQGSLLGDGFPVDQFPAGEPERRSRK